MKKNIKVGILVFAAVIVVVLILGVIAFERDMISGKNGKTIEGPTFVTGAVEPYDPAASDYGISKSADKIDGRFDVSVGECYLRSYPERDDQNVYGKLKENCLIHVDGFYISVAEDGQTFYGVRSDRLTAEMIEAAEGCKTKFDADKDGIVWFAKSYASLSK